MWDVLERIRGLAGFGLSGSLTVWIPLHMMIVLWQHKRLAHVSYHLLALWAFWPSFAALCCLLLYDMEFFLRARTNLENGPSTFRHLFNTVLWIPHLRPTLHYSSLSDSKLRLRSAKVLIVRVAVSALLMSSSVSCRLLLLSLVSSSSRFPLPCQRPSLL